MTSNLTGMRRAPSHVVRVFARAGRPMSESRYASRSESGSPERPHRPRRSEAGDTMVEVLLALIVLGLASVALITAFSTSISASSLHRKLASADIVLNSSSQQAIAGIGSHLTLFTSCVTPTTTPTTIASFLQHAGITIAPTYSGQFTATITNVLWWNASASVFDSTCRTGVPEEITVTVTDSTGHQYTNSFVVDYPLASATSSTNVGPATQLVWATQPASSATSGAAFSTQPVLEVENSLGQPVTSDYSPIVLSIASGSNGTLSSCSGNENSGFVAFSGCAISITGGAASYTLQAVDGSLTSPPSTAISVSGSTQPNLVFTTEPVTGAKSGDAFATQPVLTVEQNGSPITWSGSITLTSSGGVLSGCTGLSTTTGVFNVAGCTFQGGYIYDSVSKTYAAIPYTLYASGSGLTAATSTAFTVKAAGAASKMVFTSQPTGVSSSNPATVFSTQPAVTVEDSFGNIVTAYNTSITMAISAGQTLSGCAPVTPTNGVATFSKCAGSAYATGVTLSASSTSLPTATSAPFNITGLASTLVFTTQPVPGVSGATFGVQLVVTIYDTNNFVVTASMTPITLSVTPPTSGATLSLCTGLTPVNGVVTVSTCTFAGVVGTNYTLTATQGSLSVASAAFSPTGAGAPTKLAFTTQPVAGASQSAFTVQPVVKVEDSAGNVVISDNETITLTSSGGVLSGCSNLNAVTGVINVGNCVFQGVVGTNYQLVASTATGSLASATSANFTPTSAGPASQVLLSGCAGSVAWSSTCVATAVISDVQGNPELSSNSPIVFSQLSSSGGAVSGLGTVTAASGSASDTLTATSLGTLTIGAAGDGFTSAPLTVTVVGAAQTAAFYTDGSYTATTTTGSTTYGTAGTYATFAKGSQNGAITFSSTTTSVCTINATSGAVTTVAAGTCNLTAVAGATGNYAASTPAPFTLTITPAPALTVTAANQTVTYSGTTATADASTVAGLVGTDAATVTSATYTYAGTGSTVYGPSTTRPTAVGTYAVTPSAATLNFTSGTSANYVTPDVYVAGTLVINKAPALSVTAANQTLAYTGTAAAADTSTVTGLVGPDAATVTSATYTYAGTGSTVYGPSTTAPTSVGTYSVTPSAASLTFTKGALGDYTSPNTYVAGTLKFTLGAADLANGTANASATVTSATTFTATSGAPVLVLVSYDDKNGNATAFTCNAALTGTALNASSLVAVSNLSTWIVSGNGANQTSSQMCVYKATGTGVAGTATVGFSGTIVNASIQVVQIEGDNSATFALADFSAGSSAAPSFLLSAAPAAGSSEILFGVSSATTDTWSTPAAGFTNLFGATDNATFTPAVYLGAPAAATIAGTLSTTAQWGTIGIEVIP